MLQSIGRITVPVAGTPVRVTSGQSDPAARLAVHGVLVQALPGNAGRVYIGTAAMNRVTQQNLFAILAIPTANQLPTFSAALTLSPNAIQLQDMYVDVDTNNDGVIVSVLVT
jgi:hypothetical protein